MLAPLVRRRANFNQLSEFKLFRIIELLQPRTTNTNLESLKETAEATTS